MKRTTIGMAWLAALLAWPAHATVIGFTGPYAPGTWTSTFTGNLGFNGGQTVASSMTVQLIGGDAPSPDPINLTPACTGATYGVAGPCEVRFVTTNIQDPFVFDWSYTTADQAGPGGDLFGLLIDGARVQLSDPGGATNQNGHVSISANTSFGWYVNCTDCIEGAATATITNFAAGLAVPEPETVALIGFGVAGVAFARRTRRAQMDGAAAVC